MSPAHLYNFFKNKLDLAVAVLADINRGYEDELRDFLKSDQPVEKVLLTYFDQELMFHARDLQRHAGMKPLLQMVRNKNRMAYERIEQRYLKNLSVYLDRQISVGQIKPQDPVKLAQLLHVITHSARYPTFGSSADIEIQRHSLRDIIELLMTGILTKKMPSAGKAEG